MFTVGAPCTQSDRTLPRRARPVSLLSRVHIGCRAEPRGALRRFAATFLVARNPRDVADRALISLIVITLYPHLLLSVRRLQAISIDRSTRRRQLSIDISCPQGAQQQTSRTPLLLSVDGTDGRTPDPIHIPISCSAYYAGSVSK